MKSTRLATLCVALGLASFLSVDARAAITVDGVKDADYGTPIAVQSVTSGWGSSQVLASLSAVQQGSSLYVFLAGRPEGSAFMLFVDSKPGGVTFIPNNLISAGGEESAINNFGASTSAGMTFETGFQPDYAIRVYGEGNGGTGAWAAVYPLTAGASRSYIGNSADVGGAAGAPVTLLKSSWQNVTGAYSAATQGAEIQFNIAQLGVPSGTGQTVKFMAMMVNGGSDYGSNQVLGSLPAGSGDLAGNMKTTDFNTVADTQTLSTTVDNADADADGTPDATDPDDDNDGLTDAVETNTGIFVDATNTGSNPFNADTDGDGMNDKAEVDAGRNPNKYNYSLITVVGAFQGWTPAPSPTNAPINVMSKVSGTEFQYELLWRFSNAVTTEGKFAAGSWSVNWGASTNVGVANPGAGNIQFNATASGLWKFAFNTDTLAYSLTRQAAPATYADWAAQYGLAVDSQSADPDLDLLTNSQEFAANTDPENSDTDGDGLFDVDETSGDYSFITPAVPLELNGKILSPITGDTDGDGLRDLWEITNGLDATDNGSVVSYVNATGLTATTNPNGAAGDPDNDGLTNLQEQIANSNPRAAGTGYASAYPKISVPGSFTGWNAAGDAANTMQLVGNFTWNLIVYFASVPVSPQYKFAAGGWGTNWGDTNPANGIADLGSGDNISGANVFTAPGYYMITFNDSTLAYTANALGTIDLDTDGLPDAWEAFYGSYLTPKTTDLVPATAYVAGGLTAAQAYAAGSNPVADTVAPAISLATGVDKVSWVANGGTINLANSDVTASDAITTNPVISFNPTNVDTAVSTNTLVAVTYTATDAASNSATVTRVIAVGDVAPGYRNLRYPAAMTIHTATNAPAYGEIYVDGATAGTGAASGITAWIGVNTNNTDPATWDNAVWSLASYVGDEGNNDNHAGQISGVGRTPGTYYYATRFQLGTNNTNYFYGGIGTDGVGGTWGGTRDVNVVTGGVTNVVTYTNGSGLLTVQAARTLTFAVNMNVQTNKSLFTPTSQGVEVRGSFNSWAGGAATLTDADNDGIYTGSFTVAGDLGATVEYKFYRTGATGAAYEGLGSNRALTLGADGVNDTLATAYFNNDDGIGPVITLTGASTINLNVGDSYVELGATATDSIDGSVSVTPSGTVTTSLAGTYTVTYNASDAAGNAATPVTRTVNVAAAPSGSTFAGWAGGATLDATNVGKYGIGGASSPTATDGVKPTSTVSGGNLVLTAIVRVDDPKLSVVGEAVTSLADYGTPASITSVTGSATGIDQTGVPTGFQKQAFTVPQEGARKFLRLKATLAP